MEAAAHRRNLRQRAPAGVPRRGGIMQHKRRCCAAPLRCAADGPSRASERRPGGEARVCARARSGAHARACVRARMHACVHARMHACVRAGMHACVRACVRARVHACGHARACACAVRARLLGARRRRAPLVRAARTAPRERGRATQRDHPPPHHAPRRARRGQADPRRPARGAARRRPVSQRSSGRADGRGAEWRGAGARSACSTGAIASARSGGASRTAASAARAMVSAPPRGVPSALSVRICSPENASGGLGPQC